jgi:hypothetical protein
MTQTYTTRLVWVLRNVWAARAHLGMVIEGRRLRFEFDRLALVLNLVCLVGVGAGVHMARSVPCCPKT